MITITRKLEFDAGHRVYGHESKCAHVHGHRYVVEVVCVASELDSIGRVIDFSVIKQRCGKWIDDKLDHGMILSPKDPLADIWRLFGNKQAKQAMAPSYIADKVFDMEQQKHYIMEDNPTAENIAKLLYCVFNALLHDTHVKVLKIVVHETPNCSASYIE